MTIDQYALSFFNRYFLGKVSYSQPRTNKGRFTYKKKIIVWPQHPEQEGK